MNRITQLPPFKRLCVTIGALPSSYIDSMSYYETLVWLCKYLQDTIIPAVNNNSEAITELQTLFTQLKDYVDNYFENLDIQTEIDNKLDEMSESGELAEIVTQYLEINGVLGFDVINDLKGADNLIDGSIAKTLGKLNYLDGLGAFYKVRTVKNTDVIDDYNIVGLTNYPTLVAEIIPEKVKADIADIQSDISDINDKINNITKLYDTVADMVSDETLTSGELIKTLNYYANNGGGAYYEVTETSGTNTIALNNGLYADIIIPTDDVDIKQFGCYGDGTHDDTINLNKALTYASTNGKNLYISKGDYLISEQINVSNCLLIYGNSTKNDETIIKTGSTFSGSVIYCTVPNYMKIRGLTIKNNGIGECIVMHGENCEIYENNLIVNSGDAIKITGANTKLHDNQIYNDTDNSIVVSTSTVYTSLYNINSQIYNNYCAGTGNGIKIINENGHRIEGLFIHDNILVGTGSAGIEIQNGLYINITNNMIDGYTRLVYFVLNSENVGGVEITNNYLGNGSSHGLGIDYTGTYTLSDVIISKNKAMNATNFTNFGLRCSQLIITDNDLYGHAGGDTGIGIYKAKNVVVSGNKVNGFTNWIVMSDKDSTGGFIVTNNLYSGNTFKDMVNEAATLTMANNRTLI